MVKAYTQDQKDLVKSLIEAGRDEIFIEQESGVSDRTIRRWKQELEKTGRIGKPPESRTGRRRLLTPGIERALFAYLRESQDVGIDDMIWWLHDNHEIVVGPRTIRRTLARAGINSQHYKSKGRALPNSGGNGEDDSEEEGEGGTQDGASTPQPLPQTVQQTVPQYQSPYTPTITSHAQAAQPHPNLMQGVEQSTPQTSSTQQAAPAQQPRPTQQPPSTEQAALQQQNVHQQQQYPPQSMALPNDEEMIQLELKQLELQKQKIAIQEHEVALKLQLRRMQRTKAGPPPQAQTQSQQQALPQFQQQSQQQRSQQQPQLQQPLQQSQQQVQQQVQQQGQQQIQHQGQQQAQPHISPSLATPSASQSSATTSTPLSRKRDLKKEQNERKNEKSRQKKQKADEKALEALRLRSRKREFITADWVQSKFIWPLPAQRLLAKLMHEYDCYSFSQSIGDTFESMYSELYSLVDRKHGDWKPQIHDEMLRERMKRKMGALRTKMVKSGEIVGKQQGGNLATNDDYQRADDYTGAEAGESIENSNVEMEDTMPEDPHTQPVAQMSIQEPGTHAYQSMTHHHQPQHDHHRHQQQLGQQMQYDMPATNIQGAHSHQQDQMSMNGHMSNGLHQYPDPQYATTPQYSMMDARSAAMMGYGQLAMTGHGVMGKDGDMMM